MKIPANSLLSLTAALLAAAGPRLQADVVLDEPFGYPDGPLVEVSAGKWSSHSGTSGPVTVTSEAITLSQSQAQDVNAALAGGPYAVAGATVLYVKFTARFSALPGGNGTFFAHFKDNSNTGFRGRVFASVTGAAEGRFRLGISESANSPSALLETDLDLDTPLVVVLRYDVASAASTLWVNATAETDPAVTASDDGPPLSIAAFAFRQSLNSGNGMGMLVVDDLRVATSFEELFGVPQEKAPGILTQPQSQSVTAGGSATFSVSASGTPPLSFQWQRGQADLPGALSASLTLDPVTAADAGAYRVIVSNHLGSAISDEAILTVTEAPVAVETNIAHLRTLLDPVDLTPVDTATLFTVEGVVTTWVNLTGPSANVLFYLQDETGGLATFWTGGTNGFIPRAGDRVRVTAPLGHFNGLLQLEPDFANPAHKVERLGADHPLPAPRPVSPTELIVLSAAAIEADWEGRLLTVTNVTLSDPAGLASFPGSGNLTVTDEAGAPLTLRVDARTDLGGQPVPHGPFAVIGVLAQYDTSAPRDSGYQLLPTRYADIIAASIPPVVRFTNRLENLVRTGDLPTNTFTELGLRRGGQLTIQITVTDPLGNWVAVQPVTAGLPSQAEWAFTEPVGPQVDGTFTMTAGAADQGTQFDLTLLAWNATATNTTVWKVYVPTAVEERVAITEYLANPTGNAGAAHFNPLRRDPPAVNTSTHDEFLELANLGDTGLDLAGWSIADAVQVRHRFYESFVLGASNAVVVYGGPLNGFPPALDVPAFPASEGSAGLALNNDGDTITLRNQVGGVVERLVYTARQVSSGGSMSRVPTIDHDFMAQTNVATLAVTPGRQYDGRRWSEPLAPPVVEVGAVAASLDANGSVRLIWTAVAGQTYSVQTAPDAAGPWTELATGLIRGEFTDAPPAFEPMRFYRVRTP
jgi:hypothetical protein